MIPHVKMLPECRNVTKQNCVTLWETDPDGKQVGSNIIIIVTIIIILTTIIITIITLRSGLAMKPVSQLLGKSVSWFPRLSSSLSRRSTALMVKRFGTTSPKR